MGWRGERGREREKEGRKSICIGFVELDMKKEEELC